MAPASPPDRDPARPTPDRERLQGEDSDPATPGGESEILPDLITVPSAERGAVARLALFLAAAVFLVLGVVFWLLPVVTGIPFYVLGFVCLGMASPGSARFVNRQERRLPRRVRRLLRTGRGRTAGPAQR